jgi:hypothetical protein
MIAWTYSPWLRAAFVSIPIVAITAFVDCRDYDTAQSKAARDGAGASDAAPEVDASAGDVAVTLEGGRPPGGSRSRGGDGWGGAGGDSRAGKPGQPEPDPASGGVGDHNGIGGAGGTSTAGEGAGLDQEEPVVFPSCVHPSEVTPTAAKALGVSMTFSQLGAQLYTGDLVSHNILVRWPVGPAPEAWTPWYCFDLVPRVARIAATNLPNGHPEIFATTTTGMLVVRRSSSEAWTPWLPFPPPALAPFISDVAAAGGERPGVYVIANGQVHGRRKVDASAYASYGPWHALESEPARLLSATLGAEGMQRIAILAEGRHILTAQQSGSSDAAYGEWESLGIAPEDLIDLEIAATQQNVTVYTLSQGGAVHARSLAGEAVEWQELRANAAMPAIVSLAAQVMPGGYVRLFGVTAAGFVLLHQQEDDWVTLTP